MSITAMKQALEWYDSGKENRDEFIEMIKSITAIAEACEPVLYQRRMRPEWRDREWFPWEACTKECADDFERKPILNNWIYEVRRLYLAPQPAQLAKPLTINEISKAWAQSKGDVITRLLPFARAIEAAHGIKEQLK